MKKFFTLCFSLLMGCAALNAQVVGGNVDETFQFADAEGNVIPNGSRIVLNNVETDPMGSAMINSNLHVVNTSDEPAFFKLTLTVNSINGGNGSICYPIQCQFFDTAGQTVETAVSDLYTTSKFDDIRVEFFPVDEDASSEISLQITKYGMTLDGYGQPVSDGNAVPGSKITVFFTTDQTAGITDATVAESNEVVARYTLDGRAIDAPQKGVNIVKYADGRTVKVVVK